MSGAGFRGIGRPVCAPRLGRKIFHPSPNFFHPARLDSKFNMLQKLAIWASSKQGPYVMTVVIDDQSEKVETLIIQSTKWFCMAKVVDIHH